MRPAHSIFFFLILVLAKAPRVSAQDTLRLTKEECEASFLRENLLLIAEKLQITKAEARLQQAKLWPNPHFTLDQVNLWATQGQTGGEEAVPPLFGNFGRNQQFGAEIEQLILTARKRGKLVALEQVNIEKASRYFEDLLRNLKIEFRKNLTDLQHLQLSEKIYENQLSSVTRLLAGYRRQVEEGNIPRSEFIRLKALELEIFKNLNDLHQRKNETQKELRQWMRIDPTAFLVIQEESFLRKQEPAAALALQEITEEAKQNRPDLHAAALGETYALRQIDYEKAKRTPDITLKGMYDRNGNTMLNFFGFGASIDLPLFDRNQGNIRHARIEAQQARKLMEYQTENVENEVTLAYRNLISALAMASRIEEGYERSLDDLLAAYTRNFASRNMSLLEYLDFMDAYLHNKRTILDTQKSVNDRIEELNYSIGRDIL